jgi:hypothetical protein
MTGFLLSVMHISRKRCQQRTTTLQQHCTYNQQLCSSPFLRTLNLPLLLLQYQCSCCNASHALAIQRSVQPLLLDDELGLSCKAGLVMLACKICDPQVRPPQYMNGLLVIPAEQKLTGWPHTIQLLKVDQGGQRQLACEHAVYQAWGFQLLDDELGLSCKAGLVMVARKICDPQVHHSWYRLVAADCC